MKRLSHNNAEARARRERYIALRREGLNITDAGASVGVTGGQVYRYERWFKTAERGEQVVPASRGTDRSAS